MIVFSRSVNKQKRWYSNGEFASNDSPLVSSMTPNCLAYFFAQPNPFERRTLPSAAKLKFLSIDVKCGEWSFSVPDHFREAIQSNLSLDELFMLRFDVLSIILEAFPEEYTEIMWEELAIQMHKVVETTVIPLLRITRLTDVLRYLEQRQRYVKLNLQVQMAYAGNLTGCKNGCISQDYSDSWCKIFNRMNFSSISSVKSLISVIIWMIQSNFVSIQLIRNF
jgi:hypothetical protein